MVGRKPKGQSTNASTNRAKAPSTIGSGGLVERAG